MNAIYKILPMAVAVILTGCNGGAPKTDSANASSGSAGSNTGCGTLAADQICVKIGSAAPKSGGIAHLGRDNENGVQLAINEMNAKNDLVIGGKKVKLAMVGEDDGAEPKLGPVVAQKLVDAGVVGVVGHFNSGVSIPANPVYARAGIVQVAPSSTNPDYTLKSTKTPKGSISAYRTIVTDAIQGPALAKYLLSKGTKNVAVLDDATQYGKGLADEFEKTMKAGGSTISIRESATDKTTDFKAILTKIKSANPQYVFWGGMDDTGATLAKQMKELGLQATLVSAAGACNEKFIELAGAASNGVICVQAGLPLSQMEKGSEFSANYEKTFPGQKVQVFAPFAYDGAYAIVEAMKIANSTDREAIAAAMPKVNFKGVIGPVAFDEKGDIKNGSNSLYEMKDNKLNFVQALH